MSGTQRALLAFFVALVVSFVSPLQAQTIPSLPKLSPSGENFVDPTGKVVRFWGANYAGMYPASDLIATNLTKNLASRGINLARLHHMRDDWPEGSLGGKFPDWSGDASTNPNFGLYTTASRPAPAGKDATSWSKFDRFNAELQRNGIYTMLSVEGTAQFTPLDSTILNLPADDAAWKAAVNALRKWEIQLGGSVIDLWKMLPVFDERSEALHKEFVTTLFNRTNPITGVLYKNNSQILTVEIVNEFSSYYTIEQGNRFSTTNATINTAIAYFDTKLRNKYNAYRATLGKGPDDIYTPTEPAVRRDFLLALDRDYRTRMKTHLETLGVTATVTFSNVWRSEYDTSMSWETQPASSKPDGYAEDHIYANPFTVEGFNYPTTRYSGAGATTVTADMLKDFTYYLSNSKAVAGKPYILGEFNIIDQPANSPERVTVFQRDMKHRTMMQLASAAYGSLHNWAGVTWFAFQHGEGPNTGPGTGITLNSDGWASDEAQDLATAWPGNFAEAYRRYTGQMWSDGQRLDHMRTTALMFRNSLVSKSVSPKVITVGPITTTSNWLFGAIDNLQVKAQPGWANVSGIRKQYGAANQIDAALTGGIPIHPVKSDTNEIIKDVKRQQLTVSAAKAEGFSGYFDAAAPAGLKVLTFSGAANTGQFGTVVLVANDGQALSSSSSLILSRTAIASNGAVVLSGPNFSLKTLKAPLPGQKWRVRYTRPRSLYPTPTLVDAPLDGTGAVSFSSTANWTEAELVIDGVPTVPVVTAPTGTISTQTPTYVWTPVAGATSYKLRVDNTVNGVTTTNKQTATRTPAQAGCTATQCSYKPTGSLNFGTATVWVTAVVGGVNKQSAGVTFTIAAPKPVLILPLGSVAATPPNFKWAVYAGGTYYNATVLDSTGAQVRAFGMDATACAATECAYPVDPLPPGTFTWKVSVWVPALNISIDSDVGTFTVSSVGTPTAIAPVGTLTASPATYIWSTATGASWYDVTVKNSAGTVVRQFGVDPTACSGTQCSYQVALLPTGSYTWVISAWIPAENRSAVSPTAAFVVP